MESKFLIAKELFDFYLGSKYQMARDDKLNEYLKYNIPKEVEFMWIEGLFDEVFRRLDYGNCDTIITLTVFIHMHPYLLMNKLSLLERFISDNCKNSICQKEIKKLLNAIIEELQKVNDKVAKDKILKLNKLKDFFEE